MAYSERHKDAFLWNERALSSSEVLLDTEWCLAVTSQPRTWQMVPSLACYLPSHGVWASSMSLYVAYARVP